MANLIKTPEPAQGISMAQLAKQLSLSVGTVSQALNRRSCVNESTRQRVIAAAAKVGYVPNRQAAALRKKKSCIIGLLVPTLSNPIYIERVASAQQVAYEQGYEISFACSEWRPDQEATLAGHFLGLGVDALIIDGHVRLADDEGNGSFEPLIARGIPILQIAHGGRGVLPGASRISIDVAGGVHDAVEHLLGLGHRHLGLIGIRGEPGAIHAAQRRGVDRAIGGCPDAVRTEFIGPAADSMESAYEAVAERLRQPGPFPTALQTVGDQLALGVLKALQDHGLRVPRDVSLVGFDNLAASAFFYPSLTTVSQTHLELGRTAVEAVIDRVENKTEPQTLDLKLKLVVRESTGPVPIPADRAAGSPPPPPAATPPVSPL